MDKSSRRVGVRRHLSYANVMASVAVFIALGGTGYAAAKVRTSDIASRAVTNAKLATNAVTSAKVRNGSLLAADFAAGQLPAGPQGPQGVQGQTGAAGPAGSARAYGHIRPNGTLVPGRASKGIANVSRPQDGVFCITLSFSPADAVVIASIDGGEASAINTGVFAYWYSDKTRIAGCNQSNDIQIVTTNNQFQLIGGAAITFAVE
jgi:hypothetical protein